MKHLFTGSIVFSLFLFLFNNCLLDSENHPDDPIKISELIKSPEELKGIELLDKCITAHGGLDNWNKYNGLSYQVESSKKWQYQLTQLKDRRTYSKSEEFEMGSDGKQVWVTPNADNIPGKSASFYYNVNFYFIAIPFVFKDSGVNAAYLGKNILDGKIYDLLKISFGSNIGQSADDLYFLYLDPENHQVAFLTHTVSFFDNTNEKVNSAKKYLNYNLVQGILMPTRLENYRLINRALGENTNRDLVFKDIKFHNHIPDEKVFEVPEMAIRESL